MRKLLMVVLLCFLPSLAKAADLIDPAPLVAVPAGPDNIVSVKKGEPVPFDGQLFDAPTAIRWANFLRQANSRLKLDPLYQYNVDQVEVSALKKVLSIEQEKYSKVTKDLETQLAAAKTEATSPPFYKTFAFGFGVGVAVTIIVVVGAAVVVNSVK